MILDFYYISIFKFHVTIGTEYNIPEMKYPVYSLLGSDYLREIAPI